MRFLVEPLLPPDAVAQLTSSLRSEQARWEPGALTAGLQARARKSNWQLDRETPLFKELQQQVVEAMLEHPLVRFHLIRHHLAADQRINQLLCDLTQHFGLRTPEGYRLPFLLAHARVAEVVGSTRSTVTRQLMRLRDDGYLRTEESKRQMTFTDSFCAEFCCG